ncbi:MAG: hypothetical protein ACEPOW_00820 [Bacteroidales bacterium]
MDENQINNLPEDKPKKDTLFKVFLILSFVYSGLGILNNIIILIWKNDILFLLEKVIPNGADSLEYKALSEMTTTFVAVNALTSALALVGAIFMWNLRKLGFHFFVIAQILFYFMVLYLQPGGNIFSVLIITIVFIYIYASNLKKMS